MGDGDIKRVGGGIPRPSIQVEITIEPIRVGCEKLSSEMPKKISPEVPLLWKRQATEHVQTERWLEALVYGLTHHVSEDGDEEEQRLRGEIAKHLSEISETIRKARWGKKEELHNPESQKSEPEPAALVPLDEQDKYVIVLNPEILGPKGNKEEIDGSWVPLRCLTLVHEGIHKLFLYPQILDRTHLKLEKDEEWVINQIEFYYYSQCSPPNTVLIIPNHIKRLFKTCKVSATYDKQQVLQKGVSNMADLDFNNDGIRDFAQPTGVTTYIIPPVSWDEYLSSGVADAPQIADPKGKGRSSDTVPFDGWEKVWKDIAVPPHVSVWYTSWFLYNRAWRNQTIRFFNDDRSMSFIPGDKVLLPGNISPMNAMIEGVVICYDYKAKQVWGSPYLDFGEDPKNHLGGKRFVSINDVAWVTAQGQSLDMKEAMKMAEAGEKTSNDAAKTPIAESAELEMAKLLRSARRKIQKNPAYPEAQKRRTVLELAKEFPYQKDLPDGWETSLLFVLGLKPEYLDNPKNNKETALK